ncbi:MAG: hypothetical protein HQL53_09355 [Magnetococcales bacterium]|nr:hypothetical protein [Magnetococcales bacterium]
MTIRRVNKGTQTYTAPRVSGKKAKVSETKEAKFTQYLDTVADVRDVSPTQSVDRVSAVEDSISAQTRRRQLQQTDELLESLEALEEGLRTHGDTSADHARRRLQETRDQALRTLSDFPENGDERELLQRTAVLATVELAKSERGDYR